MLRLQQIQLTQFRNYPVFKQNFSENVIGICGLNGTGKTNILDAIHYLCFTKSYFARPDAGSVTHGLYGMRIEGLMQKQEQDYNITCILRENNKKEFSLNKELYKKFSSHIGLFPCVMIAPDDLELITGASEERRKMIDTLLSQINHDYLDHLIDYNKILQQRNSLLKAAAEYNRLDESLLQILDEQLANKTAILFNARKQFLEAFLPEVKKQYTLIAGKDENIDIVYDSQLLHKSMEALLNENRQRDLYLQRTSAGIHKDDIELKFDDKNFKTVASQGQRKSLLFALKLAEFMMIQQHKGFAPLLLLDDVFEKLDQQRMHNLLAMVCTEYNAQVFITDTHRNRLEDAFRQLGCSYQLTELGI